MISKLYTTILCSLLFTQLTAVSHAASDAEIEERFGNPPAEARILSIRHHLPVEESAQDSMLQDYSDKGFGGIVTNVHFNDYMESDEHWQAFLRTVKEAKQRGMALWLYDERGYPSGLAGGKTLNGHPEWEARGLLIAQSESSGGLVQMNCPPGTLIMASAVSMLNDVLDTASSVDLKDIVKEGKLEWEAPEGYWRIMIITEDRLYEGTHAAVSLCDKLPYINLLMSEPTKRFLELTHDVYAQKLGQDLGQYFIATFTDEPSLMSLFMRPQLWSVLPWSANLPVEFENNFGRPLLPLLPHLVWGSSAEAVKARYEYWKTVGDLVSANYFGQIRDWCRVHGLPSGGHLLLEESILTHVPLYGNFYQCMRNIDAPSMDCLTSIPEQVPWQVARLIGSVADICNRDITMSETSDHVQQWRPEGDERPKVVVTEEEIRGTCNRLMVSGITTITSYYRFQYLSNKHLVRLNEWVGRCCTMLKGGTHVTDIAIVYPAESLSAHFQPSREWTKDAPASAQRIAQTYDIISSLLFKSGRDFTYIDSRAIAESTVKDGQLQLNDLVWRIVVLPCVDTMPLVSWEKLYAFWKSGGTVIAVGVLPENSEAEFPCEKVQKMATDIFGGQDKNHGIHLSVGQEALLPHIVNKVAPNHVVFPQGAPLRATHRRVDSHEVFFVINDSGEPWSGEIGINASGNASQLDPSTGIISALNTPDSIPMQLPAYGGMIFRFEKFNRAASNTIPVVELPHVTPVSVKIPELRTAKGKYVVPKVVADDALNSWTANACLTKSGVDTYLFLCFAYADAVDINGSEFLAFDVKIPENQPCNKTLLVVLRDIEGVEYIADTHIMLNDPFEQRVFVSLNQFERAPWCPIKDKTLNLQKINELRIGWGGYMGTENEAVVFNTSAPCVI